MKILITCLAILSGTSYAGMIKKVSLNEIQRVAVEVGFTQSELSKVSCIAHYESKNNTLAISPTDDHGLMQINRINLQYCKLNSVNQLYNIKTNLTCAYKIAKSKHFGWRMWTTNKFCHDNNDNLDKVAERLVKEEEKANGA